MSKKKALFAGKVLIAGNATNDSFQVFRHLCKKLAGEPSYNSKTMIMKMFIKEHSADNGQYNGDLYLLGKLLLPVVEKKVYNIKDRQLLKFFSQIFQSGEQDMKEHMENQGVISNTIKHFFKKSCSPMKPSMQSSFTLQDVDNLLTELASFTKEEDQMSVLRKISKRSTAADLCCIIKLIKHDLRMNTGPKHFLNALDTNAYAAFQASNDLETVIEKWKLRNSNTDSVPGLKKKLSVRASLMTPVKPMLAEACKSIEQAFKKCPNGMFSEIKYDGERVQIHKDGDKFQYFSRSLKQVQEHKISEIKDYMLQACPKGDSLILDGEVLLMDNKTGKPLPFGTLGIHKKSKFTDATVCYVIFDILQFNNENLLNRPICERRNILAANVTEIKNRIEHSEMKRITKTEELETMLKKCFAENLEGLVVKDVQSKYEPGKRHWLKIKKDYLQEGAMADSADLVVLGAYYGTGNKGGLISVFLMGCFDEKKQQWVTVAKCGNGHNDNTITKLQTQLDMVKSNKSLHNVPSWLDVHRSLVPDFVAKDPKKCPVWEITGAEFSQSTTHTADGISIRFPRVTKVRNDKDWKTATSLKQLKKLFEESKKTSDIDIPSKTLPSKQDSNLPLTISPNIPQQILLKDTSVKKRKVESSSSSLKTVKKRMSEDDMELQPDAKQPSKLVCQYGSNCYRKNTEHFEEYSHVSSTREKSTKEDENPSKDLINIFTNMCFLITKQLPEYKKLKRYIIAHDGDVVQNDELNDATHIISDKAIGDLGNVVAVKPDWIWSCILNKKLVPINEKLGFR